MELDTTLAVKPLPKSSGGRRVYWVHPDNVIEVQAVLLRFLALKAMQTASSPSAVSTPILSRTNSFDQSTSPKAHEIGILIIDNPTKFLQTRAARVLSDSGPTQAARPSAQVHWCSGDKDSEAVIYVPADGVNKSASSFKMKRKNVKLAVGVIHSGPALARKNSINESDEKLQAVRSWFSRHGDAKPLVQISAQRMRFTQAPEGSVWATFDQQISFRPSNPDWEDELEDEDSDVTDQQRRYFPHGVLELRWEGQIPPIVRELDASHLVRKPRLHLPCF